MAGNLDPLTPTILSLSTCTSTCEFSEQGETAGRPNLAQTAKVEQGETDDLKSLQVMSWNDR
jgi:hypothetical protein